ncbi:SSV1-like integrase, N-terminal fragment [Saccharolobus solfataricus]|uniref:SSV1-like integrase, N-terminal n=1 Tax=Saccharolobus solfataricus TaxID=2287 RepID=A0A157SYT2_SACSO|nr:SSV1-like integrase, N-terminal fragment [Saccharolobus solfataricus]
MPNFYVGSKFYVKEIKGKYYVYSIENGDDGKQRHTYIGSLEQIVNEYYDMKCGRRDLNPGSPAWEAGVLIQPRLRPQFHYKLFIKVYFKLSDYQLFQR